MSARKFKVGDLCVYRGKICRVTKVTRNVAPLLEYMGVKDGTKFNPYLTLLPLYGVDNKPVKKPKEVTVVSGSVEYASDTIEKLKSDIEKYRAKLALLEQG